MFAVGCPRAPERKRGEKGRGRILREGTIEELERGVDSAMADADVSAQERLQIASDLILDAPLGELKEVIADVQALVGGEAVLAERLPAITRRFNHEKLAVAEGEAAKVVLCEQGELGDGRVQPGIALPGSSNATPSRPLFLVARWRSVQARGAVPARAV